MAVGCAPLGARVRLSATQGLVTRQVIATVAALSSDAPHRARSSLRVNQSMTFDEIVRLVASFLGGGVVAAVGNWLHASRTARRQREIDRLREQLERLYGPLFFFTTQNQQLFLLNDKIHAAYSGYF